MGGYGEYSRVRSGLADKYRIRLNILLAGKIGLKGLVIEYGGYSGEYSPTNTILWHQYYNVMMSLPINLWFLLCDQTNCHTCFT